MASRSMSPPSESDVAIATTWDGGAPFQCAVLPWCQQAQRLSRLLVSGVGVRSATTLMLVTDDHNPARVKKTRGPEHRNPWTTVAEDCPTAKVATLDPRLRRAAGIFAHSPTGGCRSWSRGIESSATCRCV